MTLEAGYGVPTVALHTDKFDRVVRSVAPVNGMPGLRQVSSPSPSWARRPRAARLRRRHRSDHRPAGDAGGRGGAHPAVRRRRARARPNSTAPRRGSSSPTPGQPRAALPRQPLDRRPAHRAPHRGAGGRDAGHTRRRPDEIVGRMRSTHFREYWEYTVEKVAVNAVMAGARPEYFPVILALAASGVTARSSSSSAMAAMAVVNGPIRHEIGMNAGTGAHGALQPRQRHHRPGLRPALAEPPGRLGARASATWAIRATTTPTTA